ncbi:MAG: alkaline phosphatase family protein [Solirubrobacteraceae bacterium]
MGTGWRFKGRTAAQLATQIRFSLRSALLDDSSAVRRSGEIPMPAPWAAAVALLALLGFGVFVGSVLNGSPQGPTRVLLASNATRSGTSAPATPTPPQAPSEEVGKEEETSSEEPEAQTTTTPTAAPPKGEKEKPAPSGARSGEASSGPQLPPVQHVFLVVLSDEGESTAFGAGSGSSYLAKTLRPQGELIEGYYAVSRGELANAIALMSGQGPTPQTEEDCPVFADLTPGSAGKLGQTMGSGCVYPSSTQTLADQLATEGKTWKAYVEGIGEQGARGPQPCQHPAAGASEPDPGPAPGSGYVTWRDPFVYFHSLIDSKSCAEDVVGVGQLAGDLKTARETPSLAYVVPGRCHDGSPQPCAPGQPAGIPATDSFLRETVGEIERSAAYRQGGLIAITFDQASQEGADADSSGCCVSSEFPNIASGAGESQSSAAATGTTPTGGGKVGLLLISKYVKPGSFNATGEYNHFSLLRSIENLFGVPPLGYAQEPGLLTFDSSVFNAWKG